MSTKALFWALEQRIPMGPKATLIMLADWYNTHENAAWPKIDQLAEKVGCSRRSVQYHLDWLEQQSLVVKEKQIRNGRQIQNRYRLPVGVMAFQGVQYLHGGGAESAQPGCKDCIPINTIKDTLKNTINCGEPQETDLKISDVLSKTKKSRAEILEKFKPTPKGCADLWRDCRANASSDNGFAAELLVKEFSMLNKTRKRVGDEFPNIVWNCMENWIDFTKHAESTAGAFNCPINPSVPFFVKFIEAAADFSVKDDTTYGVKLSAPETLTKPIEKEQTTTEVTSIDDILAIGEEFDL